MRSLHPVVPGLWRVELGFVNATLQEHDGGLVLIDAGSAGDEAPILAAVEALGHEWADVRHVVVTHHHSDHAGALAAVVRATGAEVWMHPADAAAVRAGVAVRPYRPASGILNWALERLFIRPSPDRVAPVETDHEVEDGDAVPGGWRVVHTPGHTAGHVALYHAERRLLVAGDACTNLPVLALSVVYEDVEVGRQSLGRLAALDVETAVFGHGKPIVGGAGDRLRKAFG